MLSGMQTKQLFSCVNYTIKKLYSGQRPGSRYRKNPQLQYINSATHQTICAAIIYCRIVLADVQSTSPLKQVAEASFVFWVCSIARNSFRAIYGHLAGEYMRVTLSGLQQSTSCCSCLQYRLPRVNK